jgi:hypothetical protein
MAETITEPVLVPDKVPDDWRPKLPADPPRAPARTDLPQGETAPPAQPPQAPTFPLTNT